MEIKQRAAIWRPDWRGGWGYPCVSLSVGLGAVRERWRRALIHLCRMVKISKVVRHCAFFCTDYHVKQCLSLLLHHLCHGPCLVKLHLFSSSPAPELLFRKYCKSVTPYIFIILSAFIRYHSYLIWLNNKKSQASYTFFSHIFLGSPDL